MFFLIIIVFPVLYIVYDKISTIEVCYELCPSKEAIVAETLWDIAKDSLQRGCMEFGGFGICKAQNEKAALWFPELSHYDEKEDCVVWSITPMSGLTVWEDRYFKRRRPLLDVDFYLFREPNPDPHGPDENNPVSLYYSIIKRDNIKGGGDLFEEAGEPKPFGKSFQLIPCAQNL